MKENSETQAEPTREANGQSVCMYVCVCGRMCYVFVCECGFWMETDDIN